MDTGYAKLYVTEVLFTEGDWRMVRKRMKGHDAPKLGRWVIIQHRCGGNDSRFSSGEWTFCLDTIKACQLCHRKEPDKIQGLHALFMWNNEEDLL